MRADPDPVDAVFDVHPESSVMLTDTYGPKLADSLETEGWVPGIGFQQLVVLIRDLPNLSWQGSVQRPEPGGSVVLQISRALPALKSSSASAMSPSSFP